MIEAHYTHTNIVAKDWKRLVRFYKEVFDCQEVPPERDISEPWLAEGTGVAGAALRGAHLRLPGHGAEGPTLEIFQYGEVLDALPAAANRKGFGHIAFRVSDVAQARLAVLDAGGRDVGRIVSRHVDGVGLLTFAYVTDPEDNIIELQGLERPA